MFQRLAETRPHQSPGILALTASLEPVYINAEAEAISCHLRRHDRTAIPGVLPAVVLDMCHEILNRLKESLESKDFDQVHVRRISDMGQPVLLQGFSIPSPHSPSASLIIVLMEPLAAETAPEIYQAQACFKLTDREMHVAEHLARGLTNKEIAFTLQITEQTVKQHVKHMMLKTQATTRTGVLAQLLGAGRRTSVTAEGAHQLRHVS